MIRWARLTGIRARVTAVTGLVLAVGLVLGGVALAAAFGRGRVATVDQRLQTESVLLGQLLGSGQLPAPLPAPPGMSAQVLDGQGQVLAASPGTSRLLAVVGPGSHPPAATDRTTDSTLTSSTLTDARVRVSLGGARYQGAPVTVLVALPLTDVDEAVAGLRRAVLVVVPVVVLAGALATWVAVGAALRPVDRLRAAAADVLDVRAAAPPQLPVADTGDELERLTRTLNAMLARLHAADARQRAFVADAAHELRSPLASALVQLEVAEQAAPQDWPELTRGALVDVERLRRLVEDLLLLARLDGGEPRPRTPVDLAAYADVRTPALLVLADAAGLHRAVENLQANARRHARRQVRTGVEVDGGAGLVVVDDDGDGVPEALRERVFERWARLDDARSRDAGGAGLGLAIARAVARGSGGDLTVEDSPLGGARFVLRLPLLASPAPAPPRQARRPGPRLPS